MKLAILAALAAVGLYAQVPTMANTYLAAPVTNQSTGMPPYQNNIYLLNPDVMNGVSPLAWTILTNAQWLALTNQQWLCMVNYPSQSSTNPLCPPLTGGVLTTVNQQLVIDIESMTVQNTVPGGVFARRAINGTRSFAHGALANVWVGPAQYFWPRNPSGVCQPATQLVTPAVAIPSGQAFVCQGNGEWVGALFSWSQAGQSGQLTTFPLTSSRQPNIISWGNATTQGVWEQIHVDQGDWIVASLPWQNSNWPWKDIAGTDPQILSVLP